MSIQCWGLNPQPSEHESPPITTRPGLFWFLFLHTLLEKREQIPIFGVAKTYALCKVDQPFFCSLDVWSILVPYCLKKRNATEIIEAAHSHRLQTASVTSLSSKIKETNKQLICLCCCSGQISFQLF